MIQIGVKEAKRGFLDREAIARAVERGRRRSLAKSGGYIRQVARRSMRRRRGASRPGQPPHAHAGLIRDLLFFTYDRRSASLVVGPARTNRSTMAPARLEFGGRTRAPAYWRGAAGKPIRIKPRPFMAPALAVASSKLAGHWKNEIRPS